MLVGVALSGGGSRAALYGAAGLEALSEDPDGGRIVTARAGLAPVERLGGQSGRQLLRHQQASEGRTGAHVLPMVCPRTPTARSSTTYRVKLSQDFESALIWRQLGSFRWLNSSLAASSLFEILTERLLGGVTQGDLSQRQVAGDAPRLVVNTTLYNNGRRLAGDQLAGGGI